MKNSQFFLNKRISKLVTLMLLFVFADPKSILAQTGTKPPTSSAGANGLPSNSKEKEPKNLKGKKTSEFCAGANKTMCTMDYSPSECTFEFQKFKGIKIEKTKMVTTGSNACRTKASLISEICAKDSSTTPDKVASIVCKPQEELQNEMTK